jgi:hypothetical protein
MEFVCRRCTDLTTKPYRVTTEDGGVVLLNMLVCPSCARLAKSLGLRTVKMQPAKRAARTGDVQPMTDSKQRPVQPAPSIR